MLELSFGVPTWSSRRPYGEPLSGTMLTPSPLDESSRPHLRALVYTKRRESKATLQSYGVTAVD